ncbi:LPXTG cell wall anchor domain-containing protein [Microbacterium maritypicum]|nr:LPXTG cell wall anchor domain-containing protein [Microbacterium liquefaciens]
MTPDCLAETGANPALPLAIGVLLIVVGAGIFALRKRRSPKTGGTVLAAAVLVAVGAFGLAIAPTSAHAAGVDPCAPESSLPGSEATATPTSTPTPTPTPTETPQPEPFAVPDIVIDQFLSFTDTGYTAGFNFATVVIEPSSPEATIDWTTFDLDTSAPGIQQTRDFVIDAATITVAFDATTQMLTMQAPFAVDYTTLFPLPYQVSDTAGVTSTPGSISALLAP